MQSGFAQVLAAQDILNQAQRHAYAGQHESQVPVHALPDVSAGQRSEERAQVDSHVEQREAGVAPMVFGR